MLLHKTGRMTGFFRPPLDQGHIGNHRTKNWESWSHADGADHATLDMQWVARDLMDTCSTCHFPVNFTWLGYMVIISFYQPTLPTPTKDRNTHPKWGIIGLKGFSLLWSRLSRGLEDVISRDEAGWSPICYAALRGDPAVWPETGWFIPPFTSISTCNSVVDLTQYILLGVRYDAD